MNEAFRYSLVDRVEQNDPVSVSSNQLAWVGLFRLQDSDFCQKAIKMELRCIFRMIFHFSGFKL